MDEKVEKYIVAVSDATRSNPDVMLGVSPRGSIALARMCQAYAFYSGKEFVIPDDVKRLAPYVLSHRLVLTHEAQINKKRPEDIIAGILRTVPVPSASYRADEKKEACSMKLRSVIGLLLLGLCITAAAQMENVFGRMPLCLLVSTALVSIAYAILVHRAFSFTESTADKVCTRGKKFRYRFVLANDTPMFFPHIRAAFFDGSGAVQKDLAVKPHQSQTIEMDFRFRHIGEYDVGFLKAKVYGLLGFFFLTFRNCSSQIIVLPRIEEVGQPLSIERDEDPKQSLNSFLKSTNTENLDGVRPYVPGDSMKRIHWKLTAHTGKYMSRLNDSPESYEVAIFIDLNRPETADKEEALCVLDRLIESALTAANDCIRRNSTVHILFHRDGQTAEETVTDFEALGRVTRRLALCGYCAAVPVEDMLRDFRCEYQKFLNFIVCTPNLNYDLACSLAEMKNERKNPVLFYVTPGTEEETDAQKAVRYLADRGIDVRKIPAQP